MKYYFFLVLFCLNSFYLKSQQDSSRLQTEISTFSGFSKTERDSIRSILFNKYDTLFENKEFLTNYINETIESEEELKTAGETYENWNEALIYLNGITKELLQDKWLPPQKIIIVRDPTINAYMNATGNIYLNIGMLANVSTESELVSVIAHEYGHYIFNHASKNYINYQTRILKAQTASLFQYPGSDFIQLNAISKIFSQSRESESEADKYATQILSNSRFSSTGMISFFKKLLEEEKKEKKVKEYTSPSYYKTHPSTETRILTSSKQLKTTDTTEKKDFLINKNLFEKIKKQANDECINLHLTAFNYEDAIENCFKQLLIYPTDEYYLFCLNESLRRFLVKKPQKAEKFFITDRYNIPAKFIQKGELLKVSNSKKFSSIPKDEISKLIQYQYKFLLFLNGTKDIQNVVFSDFNNKDTLQFISYNEALNFFIKYQESLHQSSVSYTKHYLFNTPIEKITTNYKELNAYNNYYYDSLQIKNSVYYVIPLNINYMHSGFFAESNKESNIYHETINALTNTFQDPLKLFNINEMSFNERNSLFNFLSYSREYGIQTKELNKFYADKKNIHNDYFKRADFKVEAINPEIIGIIKKYHLDHIIFFDISFVETVAIPFNTKEITFSNYYIGITENKFQNQYFIERSNQNMFQKNNFVMDQLTQKLNYSTKNFLIDIKNDRKK